MFALSQLPVDCLCGGVKIIFFLPFKILLARLIIQLADRLAGENVQNLLWMSKIYYGCTKYPKFITGVLLQVLFTGVQVVER